MLWGNSPEPLEGRVSSYLPAVFSSNSKWCCDHLKSIWKALRFFFFNPNPSPWPVSRAWQDVWSTHLLPLLSDSSKGLLSVLRMAMLVSTWKHCTSFLPENHSYGSQHAGLFLAFKSQLNLISSERIFSITQSELYHQPLSIILTKHVSIYHHLTFFFCCCCCSFVRI